MVVVSVHGVAILDPGCMHPFFMRLLDATAVVDMGDQHRYNKAVGAQLQTRLPRSLADAGPSIMPGSIRDRGPSHALVWFGSASAPYGQGGGVPLQSFPLFLLGVLTYMHTTQVHTFLRSVYQGTPSTNFLHPYSLAHCIASESDPTGYLRH
jgi:hypothetical protein